MENTKTAGGLCAACKHDPGCIYEAASAGLVLQCEQFELAFPDAAVRPASPRPGAFSGKKMDVDGYAGLCSNCENRFTCIYPRPEGGVWHCDEYL